MTSNERDYKREESENRVDNRENRVDYIGKIAILPIEYSLLAVNIGILAVKTMKIRYFIGILAVNIGILAVKTMKIRYFTHKYSYFKGF